MLTVLVRTGARPHELRIARCEWYSEGKITIPQEFSKGPRRRLILLDPIANRIVRRRCEDGGLINNAKVTSADIACSNGIIHEIDVVLMPPSSESANARNAGELLSVEGVGSFKTLFAAIEAAGLMDTLEKDGPFTIFAPTDEAFAALAEGTVESLLKPENREQLLSILTYHVVAGEVPSSAVVELRSAETVNGAEVTIEVEDGIVRVNEATVLKTDVPCEVGLIHAIDKVLLP